MTRAGVTFCSLVVILAGLVVSAGKLGLCGTHEHPHQQWPIPVTSGMGTTRPGFYPQLSATLQNISQSTIRTTSVKFFCKFTQLQASDSTIQPSAASAFGREHCGIGPNPALLAHRAEWKHRQPWYETCVASSLVLCAESPISRVQICTRVQH